MKPKIYKRNILHHLLFAFILMAGFSQNLIAQKISVTGTVLDDKGSPVPAASILIKGTSSGTVTDVDGRYSIKASMGEVLIYSSVSFLSQEVTVTGSAMNIVLTEDANILEQVVVIGYGSLEKRKVTSAITNVDEKDFNKGNVNNPAQLLQGKVAGLSIVAPQGNPNGNFDIRLRGLSTLGANSQPLVIIDGVAGVNLNSVDPNDIASIDVLKDGGAAAIYGTRGSSGVIIITTKNGISGKPKLDYSGYVTTESTDRSHPVMDESTYLANGGTDLGGENNWLENITRNAVSHVHNVSLSGGSNQFTYRASLNFRDAQGVLQNSGFRQLNGRLNLRQKAFDNKLTVGLNIASTSRQAQLGFDDAFKYAVIMPPTAPTKSADPFFEKYGGYFQSEVYDLYNPVAIINQNHNDQRLSRLMYNVYGDYKITNDLTASIQYSQNNDNTDNSQYISKYSYYANGVNRNGLASKLTNNLRNDLFEMTGNYTKSFGKIDLSVLGGYSHQNYTTNNFFTQAGNFLTDAFLYNNFAAAKDFADGKAIATSSKENNKLIAFFGRANFSYDNTYFLTASLRREGSSRFGPGNKWGSFPGVSAGIDISKLVTIPMVDQLKVRASYGVTGNLPDQSYLSQQLYGPGTSVAYFYYNGVYVPVYSPQSNPNPNLKWETKSEVDFGLDFSMFKNRLTGSFDYYTRTTTDALITLEVPVPPNLFSTSLLNAGKLKSSGIELGLEYMVIRNGKFSWSARATFATYKSEVVSLSVGDIQYGIREVGSLPAPLTGNVVRVQEGQPIGQFIGWQYEGVADDGKYILSDLDNNGIINELDMTIIGNGLPKGEAGLYNRFTLGNFDLSLFFRSVFGHDLINLNRSMYEQVSRISSYNLINTDGFDPKYTGSAAFNSKYVENASFIKLDNFTIGYNFKFKPESKLSGVRAYVSGQNLFYITKYQGVDPEPRYTYQNNVLAPGVEPLNSWVTTRSFSVGLNLSF